MIKIQRRYILYLCKNRALLGFYTFFQHKSTNFDMTSKLIQVVRFSTSLFTLQTRWFQCIFYFSTLSTINTLLIHIIHRLIPTYPHLPFFHLYFYKFLSTKKLFLSRRVIDYIIRYPVLDWHLGKDLL
jgi:hypothetical protein